eukprot:1994219-Alexandrium_andersonii.AAC.1
MSSTDAVATRTSGARGRFRRCPPAIRPTNNEATMKPKRRNARPERPRRRARRWKSKSMTRRCRRAPASTNLGDADAA